MTSPNTTPSSKTVIVVGGGPAGLSCTARLISYGFRVILIEGRRKLGGRAASFLDAESGEFLDLGPHTVIESNLHFLQYLTQVGTRHLVRFPPTLTIPFVEPGKRSATFHCPAWRPPYGFLWGLLTFRFLPVIDRWRTIRLGVTLIRGKESDFSYRSIEEWFNHKRISPVSRKVFWDPLVFAIFNSSPSRIGVQSLAQALRQGFLAANQRSGLGMPLVDWGHIVVGNLPDQVNSSGGKVIVGQRVKQLLTENGRATGVRLGTGECISADAVVMAIPPQDLASMLSSIPNWLLPATQFAWSPIISMHWIGVNPLPINPPIAFFDSPLQWLFARPTSADQPRVVLSTISGGNRDLFSLSTVELSDLLKSEIQKAFPGWIPGEGNRTVSHKIPRATITIGAGQEQVRPAQTSDLPGLYLAGDWTDTGLPPTLESAVISGEKAADQVAKS
jgi:squalene-associated FAD-dependent desaturase